MRGPDLWIARLCRVVFGRGPGLNPGVAAVVGTPDPAPCVAGVTAPAAPTLGGSRQVSTQRIMHLSLLFLLGSLASVPAPAQFSAQQAGPAPGARADSGYGSRPASDYGTRSTPAAVQPSFDYNPSQPGGGGPSSTAPGYGSYPNPGEPGYGALPRTTSGAVPGASTQPASGPWTGQAGQGFRFRGDKQPTSGAWQDSPLAPGFRFRPLTPAEQEHAAGSDGWRPTGRDDRRPPPPPPPGYSGSQGEAGPGRGDAFGYEADSWFRKYYGERP